MCLLLAGGARAQTPADQKAAAEALWEKGYNLMKQGDYAQACPYLEQSNAVERGIGTMLYLAECYERLGRTASAWALFREAASAAKAEGQLERAQQGSQRAAQLEPSLSRLAVSVPASSQLPGLEVTRNGTVVTSGVWGVAIPVDPGSQRLEARAPGYEPWVHHEQVARGAQASVTVPQLTAAAPGASPPPPVAAAPELSTAPAPEPSLAPPAAPEAPKTRGNVQRVAGLVVGGAGVLALGLGTYFGISASNDNSDAERLCPENSCSDPGFELHESAQSNATLSNVFVFGGAALVAAGVVIYVVAPSDREETALTISPRANGVSLHGTF